MNNGNALGFFPWKRRSQLCGNVLVGNTSKHFRRQLKLVSTKAAESACNHWISNRRSAYGTHSQYCT